MTRTEAEAEEARVLKNWSQKQVKREKKKTPTEAEQQQERAEHAS